MRCYNHIAGPFIQLLKKNNFKWNAEVEDSFDRLKEAMVSLPILALPNFSQSFHSEIDASAYGIGAILIQNEKLISYYS